MYAVSDKLLASSKQLEILSYQHWRHGRCTGLELRIIMTPDDVYQALPFALDTAQANNRATFRAGVFILGEQFTEPAWSYQRDFISALIKADYIQRHNFESVATYSRDKIRHHAFEVASASITQIFLTNEVEQVERATFKNIQQITRCLCGLDELIG